MITFTVPGEPIAKGRAKVSTLNGAVRMLTPQRTVRYESTVALFARQAMGGRALFSGPVAVSVHAVFQVPKSWSNKRLAANLVKPEYCVKRPDFDNVLKALCDGMNGIVWVADSQVAVFAHSGKVYGDRPRVDVVVEAIA